MYELLFIWFFGLITLRYALWLWFDWSTSSALRAALEAWRDGWEFEDGKLDKTLRWFVGRALTCRFCFGFHLCFIAALAASIVCPGGWVYWWLLAFAIRGGELLTAQLVGSE